MPYHVGKKGSSDCGGYPVVDDKGKVMGCHPTKNKAGRQVRALYAAGAAMKYIDTTNIEKDMVAEGDFVIATCEDETHVGIVQYVMTSGMFGIPGSEYAKDASSENPVVLIRTLEYDEEDGWEESPYMIGSMASDVTKISPINLEENNQAMTSSTADAIKVLKEIVNELKKDGNVPVLQVLETGTPNPGYDGCGCTTCIELNCDCAHCPVCSGEMTDTPDSETQMAMYDSSIGKDDAMGSSGGVIASVPSGESSGSNFPVITTHAHVSAAVSHWMGSGKPSKLKQHIINRAREIGAEHLLPADWYPMVNNTTKRDPSTAVRERMAEAGTAMPDGSFPIANATDLRNAIQSVGRAKDYSAAKEHIIRRARALGMINTLPEDWKNKVKKTDWGGSVFDLNPFVK
jgi:hypothetical protein